MTKTGTLISTVPRKSLVIFFFGVFLLFGITSFVTDLSEMGRTPTPRLILGIMMAGTFAMMYAAVGFQLRHNSWKAMIPIFIAQFILSGALHRWFPPLPAVLELGPAEVRQLQARLNLDATFILIGVAIAYACFVYVGVQEGKRYFRAHAEIALAQEIHRILVPQIDITSDGFAFFGYSKASGEVGGDLVDVVASDGNWVAYLADVSGHGVAPGLLMGMLKSAAHMLLVAGGPSTELMQRLNQVLYPLKNPDMFSTFCQVAKSGDMLRVGSAGHPPILKFTARTGEVTPLQTENMPLGILPAGEFATTAISAEPGDVFALYTDGFVEVVDRKGEEFGIARVSAVLMEKAGEGLPAIAGALQERVAKYGTQFDDQSILLVQKL